MLQLSRLAYTLKFPTKRSPFFSSLFQKEESSAIGSMQVQRSLDIMERFQVSLTRDMTGDDVGYRKNFIGKRDSEVLCRGKHLRRALQ